MFKHYRFLFIWLALAVAAPVQADELDPISVGLFKVQMDLAQSGDPAGQYHVGEMYEKGLGTAQSWDEAFVWYTKAAAQGNAKALGKIENWERTKHEAIRAQERAAAEVRALDEAQQAAKARERAAAEAAARAKAEAKARAEAEAKARERAKAEAEAKTKVKQQSETAAKAKQQAEAKPAPKPAPAEPPKTAATEPAADDPEFKANPCKGPQAKFLSTCK